MKKPKDKLLRLLFIYHKKRIFPPGWNFSKFVVFLRKESRTPFFIVFTLLI